MGYSVGGPQSVPREGRRHGTIAIGRQRGAAQLGISALPLRRALHAWRPSSRTCGVSAIRREVAAHTHVDSHAVRGAHVGASPSARRGWWPSSRTSGVSAIRREVAALTLCGFARGPWRLRGSAAPGAKAMAAIQQNLRRERHSPRGRGSYEM